MNVNTNIHQNYLQNIGVSTATAVQDTMQDADTLSAKSMYSEFTISEGVADPLDVSGIDIPEAALSRDDDLGKLIGRAFNLPPPPMPAFAD